MDYSLSKIWILLRQEFLSLDGGKRRQILLCGFSSAWWLLYLTSLMYV